MVNIDPRAGMFYLDENNKFLSVYEITQNRDIMKRQSDWVKSFVSEKWTYEECQKLNYNTLLHPKEIQLYCPYSLIDSYIFEWRSGDYIDRDGMKEVHGRYLATLKQYYWEEGYGN